MSVLLPPIKEDFGLSDGQLGILSGIFTLTYIVFGIPVARMADTLSRRKIIAWSVAIWSGMTALCGLTQNFIQLAIVRGFVGIGESGAVPPSHSIISDYFPASMRTKALAIFSVGMPIGLIFGFIFASWITEAYSWRVAFFSLGIPGLLLALAVYLCVEEPQRGQADGQKYLEQAEEKPSFKLTLKTLFSSPAYLHTAFATALYAVVWLGVVGWLPSYFVRSFDMPLSQVGFWLSLSLGLPMLIGMLCSGVLTDIMIKRSVRWYSWIPAIAILVSTPLFIIVFGTSNNLLSAVAVFFAFLIGIFQGPASLASVQGLAHVRMRAMAVAMFLLITNLIGGTVGPMFIGYLSDYFVVNYGKDSLRWALMFVSVFFGLWSSLHYALAGKTIKQEMETLDS